MSNKFGVNGKEPIVTFSSIGEKCNFDQNTDSSVVPDGSRICNVGLICKNSICVNEYTGEDGSSKAPEVVKVYSRQAGQSCDFDRMGNIDEITNGSNVCVNDLYCNNGKCSNSSQSSNSQEYEETGTVVSGSCTDPDVIMFVQQAIGVEPDGNWGCYSQNKLSEKGFKSFQEVVQCEGSDPDPCAYGQCINGQCPTNSELSQQKKNDLVNVNEQEVIQKEEKKSLPWGWIVTGIAIAALGGTGVYLYSKSNVKKRV